MFKSILIIIYNYNSIFCSGEEPVINRQLKNILKGICHERADVKLQATRALQQNLISNKVIISMN